MATFYSTALPFTVRAVEAVLNGEVIAVAGVYRAAGAFYGFSEMREPMRARKKDILRMCAEGKRIMARYPVVLAYANPAERNAPGFLKWLGFEHMDSTDQGEVYIWTNSSPQPGQ